MAAGGSHDSMQQLSSCLKLGEGSREHELGMVSPSETSKLASSDARPPASPQLSSIPSHQLGTKYSNVRACEGQ